MNIRGKKCQSGEKQGSGRSIRTHKQVGGVD